MAHDFDVAVIGSGFGGAVAACRLAEDGYKVVVLERGRRWEKDDYPAVSKKHWLWDERKPEKEHGWFDIRVFAPISTIAGAGVGGGSLHYANVSIDAHRDLFEEGWPEEIQFEDLRDRYYPRVSEMLEPKRVPLAQFSNRTKLLKEAAQKAGFLGGYDEVELAVKFDLDYVYDPQNRPNPADSVSEPNAEGIDQGFCVHLGQCTLGCPVEARNTLALNYIPRAERFGADVRPLHIVRSIEREDVGYRVHFERIADGKLKPGSLTARIAVVAAGSVGSTELLLRCRDQHQTLPDLGPQVGRKWSTNANYLTLAVHKGLDVFPTRGPTISAAIKFLEDREFKGSRFVIEDGGVPDVLQEYLENLNKPEGEAKKFSLPLKAIYSELKREPMQNLMLWFAQGRDEPVGEFRLNRRFLGLFGERRNLDLKWSRSGARKVLKAIQEIHRKLAKETGGKVFLQLPDALITPHPLGGCPMGQTSTEGLVDHKGEVFGHQNLFVVDGAVIPRPVGHNPSKTIAALSERIAEKIIEEGR